MGFTARSLVTAPTVEPLTLAEAKAHLREDGNGQDSYIEDTLIPAARRWIESRSWRALVTQTWDLYWPRFPTHRYLYVPLPPLQSVTSVTYYDSDNALQTYASANYLVESSFEPAVITLLQGSTWPDTYTRMGAVVVRIVAGYGVAVDVPQTWKHAMNLLIGHWYLNRESVVTGTISTKVQDTVDALIDLDHSRAMIG